MMPRMRQRHGLALDADGNDRVPALVDLDRRPAKKGRKTKGSTKRSPGSKAARGHAARDSGDADAEMRWGAELVLQLALGGEVPPSASRDALAPPGKAPKGRLDDPNKRRGGDPSGAYSEPLGARSHVLVGDPIVVPSRRAASEGDLAQGPVDSRVARGAGHDASAFGLPTGPHLVKEDRDEASNVFASVAPAASQHAPLPPLRLAARAALPQSSVQAPDQTRAGAKRGGDDNSLCARILAARAEAVQAAMPTEGSPSIAAYIWKPETLFADERMQQDESLAAHCPSRLGGTRTRTSSTKPFTQDGRQAGRLRQRSIIRIEDDVSLKFNA